MKKSARYNFKDKKGVIRIKIFILFYLINKRIYVNLKPYLVYTPYICNLVSPYMLKLTRILQFKV